MGGGRTLYRGPTIFPSRSQGHEWNNCLMEKTLVDYLRHLCDLSLQELVDVHVEYLDSSTFPMFVTLGA